MDGLVHHQVIDSFVRRGYPPTVDEIAANLSIPRERAVEALQRLHEGHGVLLHPGSFDIWLAHPFSASPSAVWVAENESRGWWAPCMWCAFGIAVLAAPNATIHVRLGGETGPADIRLRDGAVVSDHVVHFALPPRDAWTNVIHFCSTVLPFRSEEDVTGWCTRHRIAQGAVISAESTLELARAWYGRHLDRDWRKWTLEQARTIFEGAGLTSEFFRIPVTKGTF